MVVPLRTQDQVLGVISVARRNTGTRAALNADDLALLEELASRAALVAHQWQALHLLETARRRLTAVSDSLPVLVCLIGDDLRYRFVNATYEKWFGIGKSEIVGKSMQEVLGQQAFSRLQDYVNEALSGRSVTFEQRVEYQAGGERVIRATYLPFEVQPGVYQGFVGLVEDISERSRMDEALVRWEQLFQHAGWGIVMTRFDTGEVVALNAAFARMHGYGVEELIGTNLFDVLTPPTRKKLEVGGGPGDPEHYQFESENIRKDGSHFACLADVVVFKDKEGTAIYRAANFQNITESKQLEDDLRAAIRARDEFLSIAAHEFRTPLTALQLQLSALQRDPVLGQQEGLKRVNDRVSKAVRQVGRLTSLIDSLLTFSIFDEEKGLESPEDFDLAVLMREVVERLDETALKVGTKILLTMDNPITVHWERSRMDQAITNVLSNAIKYGAGRPVRIQIACEADGASVVIGVQDEGIGIGAEDSKRIFGRFERAVSTNHYGGFGLGLYIANKAIVDHGGTITVDSEPGAGSTFTIRLPRVAKSPTTLERA
ncbi:MAG: PAS domain S-box protein [Deltaproteobacteria bacterium]|nr:PAS domain S-box protein [Deltaproteobacteria bacterium]